MDVFNAPNREHCIVVRERTNTPLQALVTLNDPQFVEAARRLAERALQAHSDSGGRINFIARRLLARRLTARENAIVHSSLEKFQSHYAAHAEEAKQLIDVGESEIESTAPPAELAAWTMVANQLMNLDEVLNK
jgi:hypothetical protein